ncbi:glycosyltransferase [Anoxybacillus sp. TBDG-1]
MNDKKIAFIYCVNNRQLYEESVRYVRSLHVPDGYEIEIIAIEGAKSITSGYNEAMKKTDAKYKVYLHQDVFIVNKNFLHDIISLFEKHYKLGMIGIAGAKTIPNNGVWWESELCYGKVYDSYTGKIKLLQFRENDKDYEPVQAIDGLIMITQYDIRWRDDLFTGWHFYDLSHCQEFLLAGYEVGVVRQQQPWCIHDCGIIKIGEDFNRERKKFIIAYSEFFENNNKQFLPLVSILIPAYNRPYYFEEALNSALRQTYENIEIIICDDSTDQRVENVVASYVKKYPNIQYVKNEKRLKNHNVDKCLQLANGQYVNFLLDDDLFHPQKISKMIRYFLQYNDVSLVTSYRQTIDENGKNIDIGTLSTKKLFDQDTFLDGTSFIRFILENCSNVIGELTTVMFRKKDVESGIAVFEGYEYQALQDVAFWIKLLQKGKGVYIAEPLSYFRIHSGQNARGLDMLYNGVKEWNMLINYGKTKGIFDSGEVLKKVYINYLRGVLFTYMQHAKGIESAQASEIKNIVMAAMDEILA